MIDMKKKFVGVTAVCAGALMLTMSGCSSSKNMPKVDLAGEWNIVAVDGEKINTEHMPYIGVDLETKRIYGNAGCNQMMGTVELDSLKPGVIHFAQVATSRMVCPDMEVENKVLGALNKVNGYTETADGVALTDAEGNTVISLEKRQLPEVSVNDLTGEWIIESVNGTKLGKLEKTPFLAFNVEEKTVHGNAGCNIVNGGFTQEEGKANSLKFSQMIATMMACPDMDTERSVLEALNKVASFTLNEDKSSLSLLDETGKEVITLAKNTGEKLSE